MNFATLQKLTIPEGNVESIAIRGQTVWVEGGNWAAVFKAIEDGTYKEKYAIGDTVPLYLGNEGVVNMQIAGFDVDDLADGSGKAPISWISKELLATTHFMNPELVTNGDGTYQEGTGSIGGWEKSAMRTYLSDVIKTRIPEVVRSRLVTVIKTQNAVNTSGESFDQTTSDDVWIPSYNECFGNDPVYNPLFENTDSNRIKYVVDTVGYTPRAASWWLRDDYTNDAFMCVSSVGDLSSNHSDIYGNLSLGFCT